MCTMYGTYNLRVDPHHQHSSHTPSPTPPHQHFRTTDPVPVQNTYHATIKPPSSITLVISANGGLMRQMRKIR
ncbi:hypothetical protein SeMB42_g04040 [Synchytrium endobioticum]|nr:hypothetical protein SeMB42_g04040 [Synchytrium endobioticum]